MMDFKSEEGFTLVELFVGIGIIAVLGGGIVVALNPARQFAQARNAQRWSNVNVILNAVDQRTAEERGAFETGCAAGTIPAASIRIATNTYDLAPCLVPAYLPQLPYDPGLPGAHWENVSRYDTGYYIRRNTVTGEVTVSAPSAELGETISVTR